MNHAEFVNAVKLILNNLITERFEELERRVAEIEKRAKYFPSLEMNALREAQNELDTRLTVVEEKVA